MRLRSEGTPVAGRFFMHPPRRGSRLTPHSELPIRITEYVIITIAFALFAGGCSSADPEIMQVDTRIVAFFDPETGSVLEELHVANDLFDADGTGEISEINVSHERSGLQWRQKAESFQPLSRDGQQWFPFVAAPVPPMRTIPRGTYRIEVSDLSQATAVAETTLPLTVPSSEPGDFAVVEGRAVRLPAGKNEITVLLQGDGEPRFRRITLESEEGTISLPDSRPPDSSVWLVFEVDRYLLRVSGPW